MSDSGLHTLRAKPPEDSCWMDGLRPGASLARVRRVEDGWVHYRCVAPAIGGGSFCGNEALSLEDFREQFPIRDVHRERETA